MQIFSLALLWMLFNGLSVTVSYGMPVIEDDSLNRMNDSYQHHKVLAYTQRKIREIDSRSMPAKKVYYLKEATATCTRLGLFHEADKYTAALITLLPAIKDSLLIAQAKFTVVSLMLSKGELDDIHYYLEEILDFALRHKNQPILRDAYAAMTSVNIMNVKYQDALEYAYKAYAISHNHPIPKYQAPDNLALGMVYMGLVKLDSMQHYYNKGLEISLQKKDSLTAAIALLSLGYYDMLTNNRQSWQNRMNTVVDIGKSLNNRGIISVAYSQMMIVDISNKNYESAIKKGQEANKLIRENSFNLHETLVDSLLYVAYKHQGLIKESLQYLERYTLNRQRLLNATQSNRITQLKHIHQQKEDALTILSQQLELDNRQKKISVLILLNIFILSVIAIIIWVRSVSVKYIDKLYEKEKRLESFQRESRLTRLKTMVLKREESAHDHQDVNDATNAITHGEDDAMNFSEDRRELFEAMLSLLETEKLHLDPELSQQTIITKLGTNKKYLYQAISQNSNDNFKQLINELRVQEAKLLIEKHIHDLPPDLYLNAGFNSVTSYYRAFKHFTGLSPKEYANAYLKDLNNKRAEP